MQIQNAKQQQTQDQHLNTNTQSDSKDDSGGLHGLITYTPSDDIDQTQDQSTTAGDPYPQADTQSDDDTQTHVCCAAKELNLCPICFLPECPFSKKIDGDHCIICGKQINNISKN